MNISGIRTYAGFYDYNTIKSQEVRNQQIQEAKAAEAQEDVSPVEQVQTVSTKREQDWGAIDFAKQYQPDVTYELKGVDSDIANLDVERALSDMKRDQVLQQYQFFVGESKAGEELSDNRMDENFLL